MLSIILVIQFRLRNTNTVVTRSEKKLALTKSGWDALCRCVGRRRKKDSGRSERGRSKRKEESKIHATIEKIYPSP